MKLNKNKKEKLARIELRAKPGEKAKIQRLAEKCNLSVSEYVIKWALGYEPRAVPPDAFFDFYDKLCQFVNSAQDAQTEAVLLPGKECDVATTGFWPVKNRLKEVIDYAENPDKTTDSRFLDDDLYKALRYTENDDKTDRKMYVTAINCPAKRAYAYMTATKRRYGKLGRNVAYHGFQSFRTGKVTPEEAHKIGLETARRMWGRDYEIVVTTHLNTDNLHNHIVVNSVSFRTRRKFENHISDHYKLREISDAVCQEYGKSVLPPSKFTGSRKKDYWMKKSGSITHRDLLRQDIEQILPLCGNWEEFERRIRSLGYQFPRNQSYNHISITAPGWKRAVRLDSLGYTDKILEERCYQNRNSDRFYELRYTAYDKVKTCPLLQLEKQLNYEISHSKDTAIVLVDVLFHMLLQLLYLTKDQVQQRLKKPTSYTCYPSNSDDGKAVDGGIWVAQRQ